MLVLMVVKRAWWVFGQEVFFWLRNGWLLGSSDSGIPFDEAGSSLLCEYINGCIA